MVITHYVKCDKLKVDRGLHFDGYNTHLTSCKKVAIRYLTWYIAGVKWTILESVSKNLCFNKYSIYVLFKWFEISVCVVFISYQNKAFLSQRYIQYGQYGLCKQLYTILLYLDCDESEDLF